MTSLTLSKRTQGILAAGGIRTVLDLVRLTPDGVLSLRGAGLKAVREVQDALTAQGLSLGMLPLEAE